MKKRAVYLLLSLLFIAVSFGSSGNAMAASGKKLQMYVSASYGYYGLSEDQRSITTDFILDVQLYAYDGINIFEDAAIYYTTDGSTPDKTKKKFDIYSELRLTKSCTFKAIAYKKGMQASDIIEIKYTRTKGKANTWKKVKDKYFGDSYWVYYGKNGYLHEDWLKYDGEWYYLERGIMLDGQMYDEYYYIGSNDEREMTNSYYLKPGGKMAKGWVQFDYAQDVDSNFSSWGYYDPISGKGMSGWKMLNGKWYHSSYQGVADVGWLKDENSGYWYYLDLKNCHMVTGWKFVKGVWYYLNADGRMADGWKLINNNWYYFEKDSGYMRTGWIAYQGGWYYMSGTGAMVTGSAKIDGKWYSFDSNGRMR